MKNIILTLRARFLILMLLSFFSVAGNAQSSGYSDSILAFQKSYVKKHEVVTGHDKEHMRFFPPNQDYRVETKVERIYEAPWFNMETSGKEKQVYRVYAILHFTLHDTVAKLHVYQSQRLMKMKEYADHLFVPFTDLTSGEESYENGRYVDLLEKDLETGNYILDFNKAYNPYCAYISDRYNCPVPPSENALVLAIRAGEMKYIKNH